MQKRVSTLDTSEMEKFAQHENDWEISQSYKLLHKINPIRLKFIIDKLSSKFLRPRSEIKILDIGCGGGIASKPLAQCGYSVCGIDPCEGNIAYALRNIDQNLNLHYINSSIEEHVDNTECGYDAIIALEVLEHVASIESFFVSCDALLNKGGIIIVSTINKTITAYLKAILLAEKVLRWVPVGMHEYQRLVRPSYISNAAKRHNIKITDIKGMSFNIFTHNWYLSDDISVNYLASMDRYSE